MTAKEARELALKKGIAYAEGELAPIRKAIDAAVEQGRMGICLPNVNLGPLAFQKLTDEGYTVRNHDDQRDGTSLEVSW